MYLKLRTLRENNLLEIAMNSLFLALARFGLAQDFLALSGSAPQAGLAQHCRRVSNVSHFTQIYPGPGRALTDGRARETEIRRLRSETSSVTMQWMPQVLPFPSLNIFRVNDRLGMLSFVANLHIYFLRGYNNITRRNILGFNRVKNSTISQTDRRTDRHTEWLPGLPVEAKNMGSQYSMRKCQHQE